jgi:hypothetical protein
MTLTDFGKFLKIAPELFGRLMRRQLCSDSCAVRDAVLRFLGELTVKDLGYYRRHGNLTNHRLGRLARKAGLEPALASLPIRMYEDYVQGNYRNEHGGSAYSQEEIRIDLTRGGPIDPFVLVEDGILFWDVSRQEFLNLLSVDGDPRLHEAQRSYLKSIGSHFRTVEEAREEMGRRGLLRSQPADGTVG